MRALGYSVLAVEAIVLLAILFEWFLTTRIGQFYVHLWDRTVDGVTWVGNLFSRSDR